MLEKNLQSLRKIHRISQETLAEKLGVSRQTVAKWENGESVPDVLTCERLAEIYNVSIDDLLHYDESEAGMPLPPKGKHLFGVVTVGERGQIVIPKKARDVFRIQAGDELVVLGDESQGIGLMKTDEILKFMERIQGWEEDGE